MEQTNLSKNSLGEFLESFASRRDYYIKNYRKFLDEPFLKEYFKKKELLRKNYLEQWDKSFNIFKTTNPKNYYYERLHSDLIKTLLDPATPDISDKNRGYLKILIDLLADKKDTIERYYFPNEYEIKAEEHADAGERGRIDIFIHDNTHAIIIENKSNNAPDTGNQLAKYYKHVVKNLQLDVFAIIYLPLDPLKKHPSVFADEYKEYEKDILNKTVVLPVVSADGKGDLVHGFLSKCLRHAVTKGNILAAIYINQMIKLFKFLGGNNMASGIDKELLKELFNTQESRSMARDIADVYNNRHMLITSIFFDSFCKELLKRKFETFKDATVYGVKVAEDIYAAFFCDMHYYDQFSIGFFSDKDIPEEKREVLKGILNEAEFSNHLYEDKNFYKDWVLKIIKLMDRGENPIGETIEYYTKMLLEKHAALFQKAAKLLKEQGE